MADVWDEKNSSELLRRIGNLMEEVYGKDEGSDLTVMLILSSGERQRVLFCGIDPDDPKRHDKFLDILNRTMLSVNTVGRIKDGRHRKPRSGLHLKLFRERAIPV